MAVHAQCPHCYQPVPANAQICPHCGTHLQEPGQSVSVPVQQNASVHVSQPASAVTHAHPAPPVAFQSTLPDVLKQLDATAVNNMTISGVLVAFYSGAIFAAKVQTGDPFNAAVYSLPIVLLLITIILSARVFYSSGYLTDDYPTLLRRKEVRLRYATLALEVSVALLAISVFVYLQRVGL